MPTAWQRAHRPEPSQAPPAPGYASVIRPPRVYDRDGRRVNVVRSSDVLVPGGGAVVSRVGVESGRGRAATAPREPLDLEDVGKLVGLGFKVVSAVAEAKAIVTQEPDTDYAEMTDRDLLGEVLDMWQFRYGIMWPVVALIVYLWMSLIVPAHLMP